MNPVVRISAARQTRSRILTDGHEHVRMSQEQEEPAYFSKDKVLYVPGHASNRIHAPQGHFPPRYQT
jgi:hypothetical protein